MGAWIKPDASTASEQTILGQWKTGATPGDGASIAALVYDGAARRVIYSVIWSGSQAAHGDRRLSARQRPAGRVPPGGRRRARQRPGRRRRQRAPVLRQQLRPLQLPRRRHDAVLGRRHLQRRRAVPRRDRQPVGPRGAGTERRRLHARAARSRSAHAAAPALRSGAGHADTDPTPTPSPTPTPTPTRRRARHQRRHRPRPRRRARHRHRLPPDAEPDTEPDAHVRRRHRRPRRRPTPTPTATPSPTATPTPTATRPDAVPDARSPTTRRRRRHRRPRLAPPAPAITAPASPTAGSARRRSRSPAPRSPARRSSSSTARPRSAQRRPSIAGTWCRAITVPADGAYLFTAKARNLGGTSPSSALRVIQVDTRAPAAPVITAPIGSAPPVHAHRHRRGGNDRGGVRERVLARNVWPPATAPGRNCSPAPRPGRARSRPGRPTSPETRRRCPQAPRCGSAESAEAEYAASHTGGIPPRRDGLPRLDLRVRRRVG